MCRFIITVLLLIGINPFVGSSQQNNMDEVLVMLHVERVGSVEIPAVIFKQEAYLPVKEIFDFLRIKTAPSAGSDTVTGFFINPKAVFLIDKTHILYQDKKTDLKQNDVFITETDLYLKSSFFAEVFGLDCAFNFRSLSVNVSTKLDLPAIRELQQELMRKNMSQLKGQTKADSTIARNRHTTSFGIADWSVMSAQRSTGEIQNRLDLALGGLIAGGEAKVLMKYISNEPFSKTQQFYNWRYVNNNSSIAKQFVAGNIFTQATSTLLGPVVGVQFTNAPTTYRKSFGTYRLIDKTEPDWTVELYVNNILINYTKADASGFFSFDVPLMYGTLFVKLKFYGPWGEEQVREQNISIPYNFLPANQFEYTHATGFVEDGKKSVFSRTSVNYGINNHVTIGGGVEYLSSLVTGKTMPFLNASFRIASNILFTGNYTHGVKASGLVSYRMPSNLQFDMEYSKYNPQQQAILTSYLMERKLSVSLPIRGKNYFAFSKLTLNQVSYLKGSNTLGEFLLSGSMAGVSANLSTTASMQGKFLGYAYSQLSIGYLLPFAIKIQPQIRYEYSQKTISSIRLDVEKNFFNRGYVNISYQNDFIIKSPSFNIGLRYDLSWGQTQLSIQRSKLGTTSTQSARGSLWIDKNSKGIGSGNRSHVGKGGILVVPFLDVNGNNIYDKGEPKVDGLQLHTNGGNTVRNADTTIRITELEAYTKFRLEFEKSSFENIAWQLTNYTIDVEIQPNYIQVVRLPVRIAGEVAGTVYLQKNNVKNGQGRMIVVINDSNAITVAKVLTEPDGYFSFLGLKPGSYTAMIDNEQLQKLNMKAVVNSLSFSIKRNNDGDVADGLEFLVRSLTDTLQHADAQTQRPSIIENITQPVKQEKQPAVEGNSDITKVQTKQKQTVETKKNILPAIQQKQDSSVLKKAEYIQQHRPASVASKKTKPSLLNHQDSLTADKMSADKNKLKKADGIKLQSNTAVNRFKNRETLTEPFKGLAQKDAPMSKKGLQKEGIAKGTHGKHKKSPNLTSPKTYHLNKEQEEVALKLEQGIQKIQQVIQQVIQFIQ